MGDCGLAVVSKSVNADALKQKTPNFLSADVFHDTTPILPWPQFCLGEIRGMTAICSAIQPYLHVSSPCVIAFDI